MAAVIFGLNEHQKYVIFARKASKTARNRAFNRFMRTCINSDELHRVLADRRNSFHTIGFVPTMGALHSGHRSLIERARDSSDTVVLSIFVNPTQFNDVKDYDSYPNTIEADLEMAESAGVDVVFMPSAEGMYGDDFAVDEVDYGQLTKSFEAQMRAGHFNGVVAVVRKLFRAVLPDRAFFGEKDLQQLAVIRRLARDEFPGLEIIGCPLIRDHDGLALSSRNVRLKESERASALKLTGWIHEIQQEIQKGEDAEMVLERVSEAARQANDVRLEYLDIVNALTFEPCRTDLSKNEVFAVVAANVGEVRLIDNCRVRCS
jgi:pantoate--beta-alanine ligase